MRHLVVSYHTCPLEEPGTGLAGGMNIFLRGLLPGLGRAGVETDVLTRATGRAPVETAPWPGVRILHVPCGWRLPATREGALESLPRFVAEARRLLGRRAAAYDVVSAHYWMSGVAAAALREPHRPLPLVFSYHTVEARKGRPAGARPGRLQLARAAVESRLAREADRVVFLSGGDLAATRRIYPALAGKGKVIAPGIDDAFRRPPERRAAREALGIPPASFLFVLAARPDPGKNLPVALSALATVRRGSLGDVRLLVAGQEPPPGQGPDGVLWAGPVPHRAMPALYGAADAALCPSLYESFGFVPLEALAAGLPVIAPSGGYWGRTVSRERCGIAYDPGTPGGPAASMERMIGERGLRERCAAEAARVAAPFTWARCTASWERLLRSSSRRGSPRRAPRAPASPRRPGAGRRGAS